MIKIGKEIGFASTSIIPLQLDLSFRSFVNDEISMHGVKEKKLEKFNFIFSAFAETIGLHMADELYSPVCFIVFQK